MGTPTNPAILELWLARQKLRDRVAKYSKAIDAMQDLCDHKNETDVSYHGSPMYECPDCGRGML